LAISEFRFRGAACAIVLAMGLPAPAQAASPPDEFRSEFVGALISCTAAYNGLSVDSERGSSDDEMRGAAAGQYRAARGLLEEWSRLPSSEVADLLFSASIELRSKGLDSRDKLLDLTIYCDNKLSDYLDTANARGYIP
jgi:hypothetical protein